MRPFIALLVVYVSFGLGYTVADLWHDRLPSMSAGNRVMAYVSCVLLAPIFAFLRLFVRK